MQKPLFYAPNVLFFAKHAAYAHVYAGKGFLERKKEKILYKKRIFLT